jgi:hypothetical protein
MSSVNWRALVNEDMGIFRDLSKPIRKAKGNRLSRGKRKSIERAARRQRRLATPRFGGMR